MGQNKETHQPGGHHIIPAALLTKVLMILFVLTVLTVVTAKFLHLGVLATPVAVVIAVAKALLVMAIFMGLKYETKLNRAMFATGFFFLFVLIFFCVLDIFSRYHQTSTL
jgi:cytochrome c oxidase subunit 4